MQEETSTGKVLRQKAIGIIYLIFLSLIFMTLPSDFIDSVFKIHQAYDQYTAENAEVRSANDVYALYLLASEYEAVQTTLESFLSTEEQSLQMQVYIDSIKNQLLLRKGLQETGFPKEGSSEAPTQQLLMRNQLADSLQRRLSDYATRLKQLLPKEQQPFIDQIIDVQPQTHANGKEVAFTQFFFDHNPLNSTFLSLTHMKTQVVRASDLVSEYLLDQLYLELAEQLTDEHKKVIAIARSETNRSDKLAKLRDLLKELQRIEDEKNDPMKLTIESLSDSLYPINQVLSFQAKFSDSSGNPMELTVIGPVKTDKIYLRSSGIVRYLPEHIGNYRMRFKHDSQLVEKVFRVGESRNILEHAQMGVIYCEQYNAIRINSLYQQENRNVQAEVSRGRVSLKDGIFYIWVDDPGRVTLMVHELYEGGRLKVAEKTFEARRKNMPYATMGIFKDGTELTPDALRELKQLVVHTDLTQNDETYSLASFECTLIHSDQTDGVSTFTNYGETFEPQLRKALSELKTGDLVVVRKINAKSNTGNEITLNSIVIQLK